MPIARVQLPDGRIASFEVDEGVTPDQVIQHAQQFMAENPMGGEYLRQGREENIAGLSEQLRAMPKEPAPASPELLKVIENMSGLERALVGVGMGFTDIGRGISQIGREAGEIVGLAPEGSAAEYTRRISEEGRTFDQPLLDRSRAARIGRFTGQMAATYPLTYALGGAPSTVPAAALQGAAAGGLTAAVMPVSEEENRLKNIAAGTIVGGLTGGVLKSAGVGYRGMRGDKSAQLAQELGEQSKKFKVPLTVGELRGSKPLQRVEQMLERVPFVGTAQFRERQAQSLSRAASSLVRRYAREGAEDVGEELQGSLMRQLARNKQVASELYDEVAEEAAKIGGKIRLNNVKSIVRQIAGKEAKLPAAVQDEKILGALGKYGDLDDLPFETARILRSRLGKELAKAERGAIVGSVSDEEVAALKMIYGALEQDISGFAEQSGGKLAETFRKANAFYRAGVVPFKDRALRKAGTEGFDTDQIVGMFIKADRPKLANKLMAQLDPPGRAAVKYAVLQDAFEAATGGAQKTGFSPARFASRLERLGSSKQAIFNAEERSQLEGFIRLARAAERAGQFAENPPTGMRWIDASILGGAVGGSFVNPTAVASAGGMSFVLSRMLTTDLGRKILTRAAGLPEKSPMWQHILYKEVPRALTLAERKIRQQPEEPAQPLPIAPMVP